LVLPSLNYHFCLMVQDSCLPSSPLSAFKSPRRQPGQRWMLLAL
jgi:hypothetical protein